MKYETLTIQDIIAWCQANNQVEWLKAEAKKKVEVEKYSERKPKLDANGKQILNKKGYPVYVVDKASKKVTEERPIDFMTIKNDFYETFKKQLPDDFKPEPKKKKQTMFDLINAL